MSHALAMSGRKRVTEPSESRSAGMPLSAHRLVCQESLWAKVDELPRQFENLVAVVQEGNPWQWHSAAPSVSFGCRLTVQCAVACTDEGSPGYVSSPQANGLPHSFSK